jgi:hypothetical protein
MESQVTEKADLVREEIRQKGAAWAAGEIQRLRATLTAIKDQVDRGHMKDNITADRAFEEIEDLADTALQGGEQGGEAKDRFTRDELEQILKRP